MLLQQPNRYEAVIPEACKVASLSVNKHNLHWAYKHKVVTFVMFCKMQVDHQKFSLTHSVE